MLRGRSAARLSALDRHSGPSLRRAVRAARLSALGASDASTTAAGSVRRRLSRFGSVAASGIRGAGSGFGIEHLALAPSPGPPDESAAAAGVGPAGRCTTPDRRIGPPRGAGPARPPARPARPDWSYRDRWLGAPDRCHVDKLSTPRSARAKRLVWAPSRPSDRATRRPFSSCCSARDTGPGPRAVPRLSGAVH